MCAVDIDSPFSSVPIHPIAAIILPLELVITVIVRNDITCPLAIQHQGIARDGPRARQSHGRSARTAVLLNTNSPAVESYPVCDIFGRPLNSGL